MQHKRSPHPFYVQFLDLFLIELTNWRWSWRLQLITSTIAPVLSIAALGIFAQNANANTFSYILVGNTVLSLSFGMLDKVQSHVMFLRTTGALDYFATLPIRRNMLILAMVLAFLVLTLPSLIVTVIFGALFLAIPIHPHPLLILVIPLIAIPLAGIGALIASYTRRPEDAGALSLLLSVGLIAIGPVVLPPERLPSFMLIVGRFSPATYAASALRQTLLGPVTAELLIDLTLLTLLSIAIFWLVDRKLALRRL